MIRQTFKLCRRKTQLKLINKIPIKPEKFNAANKTTLHLKKTLPPNQTPNTLTQNTIKTLHLRSLNITQRRLTINNQFPLANHPTILLNLNQLPIINKTQLKTQRQNIRIIIITISKYLQRTLQRRHFKHLGKLTHHTQTSLLCPFARRERSKQVRLTFYGGVEVAVTAFRLNLAASLKRFLFFLTTRTLLC